MKAIRVHEFGGPEQLKLDEVPIPKPTAGQVLVKVHAAGVNPYDTYMRAGLYPVKPALPYTPGSDAAGVIESIGEGVSKVKLGDRVYTTKTVTGAYAEYCLALENQVQSLPSNITFSQGAGIFVPYATAYHALLHEAKARASETVLIHGASGGVGTAAIQLARTVGLTVFGTAGTAKGLELIKQEGAHQAFDHKKAGYTDDIMKATGGRGVDVILEMLANVNLATDLKLLALFGRVIIIGSRGEITINPRDFMARRSAARGFTLWAATDGELNDCFAGIGAGLTNGTLRPVVGKELPLKDAAQAHIDVLAPGAHGKIALIP
ncbi:MAG TPA: NADPH:quinone reductase [Candidatus Acidoferrum sp.]|nr:NADPH:quinone reductase [Candidatus Acidoferrum sp.]